MSFNFPRFFFQTNRKRQNHVNRVNETFNPYEEIQFLQHDAFVDVIKLLIKIDEERFAAVSGPFITIWSFKLGRCLHTLKGYHRNPVTCLQLLNLSDGLYKDYKLLISASSESIICVWNTNNGQCLNVLRDHKCSIRCMTLSNESSLIAAGQYISVWNVNFNFVCMFERLPHQVEINHVVCVNSNFLICAIDSRLEVYLYDDCESIVKMKSLRMFRKLPNVHRDIIKVLKPYTDPYKFFVSGSLDGIIAVWSSQTLNIIHKLNHHRYYQGNDRLFPYSIQSFEFIYNLLLVSVGNGFSIFDLNSGKTCLKVNHDNMSKILQAVLIDKFRIATCSADGRIKIWIISKKNFNDDWSHDIKLWGNLFVIEHVCNNVVNDVSLQNQGCEIYQLAECVGHSGSVQMMLNFSNGGFVSGGADNLLILWKDGKTQSEARTSLLREILLTAE